MSYTQYDFPHTHMYDSDLREIINYYEKLVKDYDSLVTNIKALQEWKTEHVEEYEKLLAKVNNLESEITTFENEIEEAFAKFKSDTETEIDNKFNSAMTEFTNMFNALKNEMTTQLANMKLEINQLALELSNAISSFRTEMVEYLDKRFELFIQNLPDYENLIVHNPVRGIDTTVQVALDDLYSYFNVFGLTAQQFDSLELTCAEFDAKGLTAHEFDSNGYKLLGYPDPTYYMRDPFTGEWALVSNVVMKLFALHAGTMTAEAFDALELTCDGFDALEITAFNFDFFGISA